MIRKLTYRGIDWIDVESPTHEEVKQLAAEYTLHPLVVDELLTPTLKPKVDLYADVLYLVLHFPAIRHSHTGPSNQEIDFIVGKRFIITTHYDTIDPLHEFSKIFEVNSIIDRGDMGNHAGYIFYYMLKHIYRGTQNELEAVSAHLTKVESNIFSGNETAMVAEISKVSRSILGVQNCLRPHRQVLDSLEIAMQKLFGDEFLYQTRNLKNEAFRLSDDVSSFSQLVAELRDTNNSLVSTNQNEVMKKLAVIAFIGLPLGIVTSIIQIEAVSRPIIGRSGDFWIILAGLAALALLLYAYVRNKKWL